MELSQVLTVAGLVLVTMIAVGALLWALYLDNKVRSSPSPKHYDVHIEPVKVFSDEDIAQVGDDAREGLKRAIEHSSDMLRASMEATISGLNVKTEEMVTTALAQEFEKYQVSFAALREETIKDFTKLQKELDDDRVRLTEGLESLVAKDREARMDAFNTRLGDVVSSYIVETLDKGIDLGAQSSYIMRTLEAHKEDMKKDVLS